MRNKFIEVGRVPYLLILAFIVVPIRLPVASAGCPDHSEEYRVEESKGKITVHCMCTEGYINFKGSCKPWEKIIPNEDKPRLNKAVKALDEAAKDSKVCGIDRCNLFVARIGRIRKIPYFDHLKISEDEKINPKEVPYDWKVANQIYNFMKDAVMSNASGWRAVSAKEAQELADRGKFVIGVTQKLDDHGHVALVVPSYLSKSQKKVGGNGPWVRDAQNPKETVRASKAGPLPCPKPPCGWNIQNALWVVWEHEDP